MLLPFVTMRDPVTTTSPVGSADGADSRASAGVAVATGGDVCAVADASTPAVGATCADAATGLAATLVPVISTAHNFLVVMLSPLLRSSTRHLLSTGLAILALFSANEGDGVHPIGTRHHLALFYNPLNHTSGLSPSFDLHFGIRSCDFSAGDQPVRDRGAGPSGQKSNCDRRQTGRRRPLSRSL